MNDAPQDPSTVASWSAPPARLPVHVLTGFLGAGKTSLINRFIAEPFFAEAALVINEFGDVGIDHLLVEQSGDGVIELSDGCLCCTVRGELVDTLADLMDRLQTGRIKPFVRVVVETTGLADPGPVIQSIIGHPVLNQSYRFAGIVTVVDAVNGLSTLDNHTESRRQVALADRLVLTKSALAPAEARVRLDQRLAELNPRVGVLDGDDAALTAEAIFAFAGDPAEGKLELAEWLGEDGAGHDPHHRDGDGDHHHHHHHHDDGIRSESLVFEEAISPQALSMFIDLLRSAHGPKLLRMKGIVKLSDDPERPLVIHAVQSIVAEPVRLKAWPEGAGQKSRLVVISKDLPEGFIGELFGAFADRPAVDRPDSQALMDNPLAIPGGSFRKS